MAALDPFVDAVAGLIEAVRDARDTVQNPEIGDIDLGTAIGTVLNGATPLDEVATEAVDSIEEGILTDVELQKELTPKNVEDTADKLEGNAVAVLAGFAAAGSALEAASFGQIDQHQEYITQILAGLGIDSITGTELDARIQEGIKPAQEARVAKEHRSKFVSLQDAVEYALRNKEGDSEYLSRANAPQKVQDAIGSDEPVNPDNLVEEWGIRDDNLDILEEVSLEAMEFEELIETPAELGLIVDDEVLDLVLDLAGYPEPLKDFLRQVPDEIPRSNRVWEEKTAVEAVVSQLDTLVDDGELAPPEAIDLLPDEGETAAPALEDRFENIQALPGGSPTRSQVEKSFAQGYSDLATLQQRIDRLEFEVSEYEDVFTTMVRDEIDGDLQESYALGLISEQQYGELMDVAGLDAETQQALFAGQDLGNVADSRLQDQASASDRPVAALPGIGESRATALQAVGIETVADIAGADTETVAEAAQISPETAEELIQLAREVSQ